MSVNTAQLDLPAVVQEPTWQIKPSSPQINGKVERSHRSDEQGFSQRLGYTGDVELEAKLQEWERFYKLARPRGAHDGKTPRA